MKKRKLFIFKKLFTTLTICVLLYSCASTESEKTNSKANITPEVAEPEIILPTPEELFLQSIEGYSLTFTNVPGKTKKGKAFDSSFELTVLNAEGEPVSDFNVCLEYPAKKSGSSIVFENTILTTDENGIVIFTPEKPVFSAQTKITAYPEISENLLITKADLSAQTATADFLVESDIVAKGAIMFVFEYNENGKSPKNSYDILSGLRKKGVYQIGNAPISDTDYINASKEKIYKENYSYVGTDFGYLIGGTIKFTGPVEQTENGYTAKLYAEIYGIDMKTGEVIYENTHEVEATGSNWNYAVSNGKSELTKVVVDSLMFGL